jgi:hypothetical protein
MGFEFQQRFRGLWSRSKTMLCIELGKPQQSCPPGNLTRTHPTFKNPKNTGRHGRKTGFSVAF